jgi:hypothetical protein
MSLNLLKQYDSSDQEFFIAAVTQQMHLWIPLFSSWWIILLFHDFFDNEGNELLYLYHRPTYFLCNQCVFMLLYGSATTLFYLIFRIFIDVNLFVLLQIIVESYVISSFVYLLCFVLHNTGTGLLIVSAYCIYILLFDEFKYLSFLSIFPETNIANQDNISRIVISSVLIVMFLFIGFVFSKLRHVYK